MPTEFQVLSFTSQPATLTTMTVLIYAFIYRLKLISHHTIHQNMLSENIIKNACISALMQAFLT